MSWKTGNKEANFYVIVFSIIVAAIFIIRIFWPLPKPPIE